MTDKNSLAASLLNCALIIATVSMSKPASAMDPHQLLQRCRTSQLQSDSETGSVVVKTLGLNARSVTVPRDGISLIKVIAEPAVASLVKELSEKYLENNIANSNVERNLRSPFFFADGLSEADGVMIGRGNQLLVFPRFMLLHPLVQRVTIEPGDIVAIFDSRLSNVVELPESSVDKGRDAIQKFVMEFNPPVDSSVNPPIDSSVEFASTEELSVEGVRLFLAAEKDLRRISQLFRDGGLEGIPPGKSLDELLLQQSNSTNLSQPVFMLSRRKDQLVINYIIPFRSSGPLGDEGVLFNSLLRDPTQKRNIDYWMRASGGFYELEFRNSDKLIVTRLEKVPFFVLGQ